MRRTARRLLHLALSVVVTAGCLLVSDRISLQSGALITPAEARIGRPLTPMSYAGVARRTTRRAVYAGAAGAVAYGAYSAYGPGCVQVVNAYGQVVCR